MIGEQIFGGTSLSEQPCHLLSRIVSLRFVDLPSSDIAIRSFVKLASSNPFARNSCDNFEYSCYHISCSNARSDNLIEEVSICCNLENSHLELELVIVQTECRGGKWHMSCASFCNVLVHILSAWYMVIIITCTCVVQSNRHTKNLSTQKTYQMVSTDGGTLKLLKTTDPMDHYNIRVSCMGRHVCSRHDVFTTPQVQRECVISSSCARVRIARIRFITCFYVHVIHVLQNLRCSSIKGTYYGWPKPLCMQGIHPNPGPDLSNLHTHVNLNVHSLMPRINTIREWGDVDTLTVQETWLTEKHIRTAKTKLSDLNMELLHGKAVAGSGKNFERSGVAIITKRPVCFYEHKHDRIAQQLYDTSRWVEARIPLAQGERGVTIVSMYGISGAGNNPNDAKQNEQIIANTLLRAAQFGNEPYIICTDLNEDPQNNDLIKPMLEKGVWVDVAAAFNLRNDKGEILPTFRKDGVYENMKGLGVSRIDAILANPAAM